MMQIDEHSTVLMHFVLRAENGEVATSTYDDKPVKFSMGDGSFSDFFQNALMGLTAGAKKMVILEPDDAFGQVNPKNVHEFPKTEFKQGVPEFGEVIEFNQGGNQKIYGIVKAVGENTLTVDFNHPLAGQRLTFDVEVMEVSVSSGGCCGHDHGEHGHDHSGHVH